MKRRFKIKDRDSGEIIVVKAANMERAYTLNNVTAATHIVTRLRRTLIVLDKSTGKEEAFTSAKKIYEKYTELPRATVYRALADTDIYENETIKIKRYENEQGI